MAKDYKFDPVTGDLVRDGKGGFVLVDTAETALFEQMTHHFRAWWARPDHGSRLHDVRAFKATDLPSVVAEARRALGQLESAGRIANVQVRGETPKVGRIVVASTSRDTSTGRTLTTRS